MLVEVCGCHELTRNVHARLTHRSGGLATRWPAHSLPAAFQGSSQARAWGPAVQAVAAAMQRIQGGLLVAMAAAVTAKRRGASGCRQGHLAGVSCMSLCYASGAPIPVGRAQLLVKQALTRGGRGGQPWRWTGRRRNRLHLQRRPGLARAKQGALSSTARMKWGEGLQLALRQPQAPAPAASYGLRCAGPTQQARCWRGKHLHLRLIQLITRDHHQQQYHSHSQHQEGAWPQQQWWWRSASRCSGTR